TAFSTAANDTANATETAIDETETAFSTAANDTANATETATNQTGNPVLDALRNIFGGIMGNN
ncbi:MAG TPA: hypothetical protein VJ772_07470, partial [Nitrososphaeraceae archaeon]|nr:hypothetical protein [Nitrososphaeraceae archaeon]